jgi:hypothetical protein
LRASPFAFTGSPAEVNVAKRNYDIVFERFAGLMVVSFFR